MKALHVHVAFGFHVNCYHSYRGDTPDALGFGGDLRIMRHILDVLDERNRRGIPVRGTWDFENAYSLEKILPQYAPDIIRRVRERGDENILMGYNNGAMSAMTDDEFAASIDWAIRNPYGSGLEDVFGSCVRIIRPQEVMFSPPQVAAYNKARIQAVCLYYSCISFDAFRTFVPPLGDEQAFNPLTFSWQGEQITVLPTYSPNDVMDAGSLRALCWDLHAQQLEGKIQNDVLIFLNTDADSFLWEPMAVPKPLQRLPCFGGIGGYIDEIADLPFIRFDTPGGYLRTHAPVGAITFGQDCADGNLSGYMSWSEKPFNRLIWTRLERARMLARQAEADRLSPSFETRVRLLSTTHFGLASPVMNITREQKALALSAQMLAAERAAQPAQQQLTLENPGSTTVTGVQLSLEAGFCRELSALRLTCPELADWCACETERDGDSFLRGIYLIARFSAVRPRYTLTFSVGTPQPAAPSSITLEQGTLLLDGRPLAELQSWIEYDGAQIRFGTPVQSPLPLAGTGSGIRLCGPVTLPNQAEAGHYTFDLFTGAGLPGLCVRSAVQYPYTPETHEISSQASNLGRFSDPRWTQTAPLELTLRLGDGAYISKRNFAGQRSGYPLSDFWRAFPENKTLSSANHQLTGGWLGLGDQNGGLLLVHARQVLGSMAHCPLRLDTRDGQRTVSLNPFGTYFGPQRHYPTRGNGSSMELYLAAAPQARSLGPAYNGAWEQAIQFLFPMAGAVPDEPLLQLAEALSDGMNACGVGQVRPYAGDNVRLHDPALNRVDPKELKSVTFVQQLGGVKPLLGLVHRYFQNQRRQQRRMRKTEKKWSR